MLVNDQVLQNAATTGNGNEFDIHPCTDVTFYYTSNGTTSGGTFQLETSDVSGYTGTWSPLGAAIVASTISGDKKLHSQVKGPLRFVRARITANITGGGNITVRVVSN